VTEPETKRVVAVQLAAKIGDVEGNLRHIEDVVGRAAREHHPDMIFLPEVSTSPNISHRIMRTCARPVAGAPFELYRRLAREYGCILGAGALAIRGRDARNTYFVCEPDGAVHLHDKDQPTVWENNYYAGGSDAGVVETSAGPIGIANGFEWNRSRTAARLRGRVRLMAGGMCFPSFPQWRLTAPYMWRREHGMMLQLARETPPRMARVVGVPTVHASHVGDVVMESPFAPALPWPTIMLGETQITDAEGTSLGLLAYEDGEGYIAADVELAQPRPRDPVPPHFWMGPMPNSVHAVWHVTNNYGRVKYEAMKLLRRHSWQHEPGYGLDLPNDVPARARDGVEVPSA
jgi:predicted amidohydrolase